MQTILIQSRQHEQVGELLERFEEAVYGGSPRSVIQRVMSDLVVYLRIHAGPEIPPFQELQAFEVRYATGRTDPAEPLVAMLRQWWHSKQSSSFM